MVLRPNIQGQVQARVASGGWIMVWGGPCPKIDLVEFDIFGDSGGIYAWVLKETEDQLKKFEQKLDAVDPELINHAAQFLSRASDHRHTSEANLAGLEVKAGIAEYFSESNTGIDSAPCQKVWQPYLGVRISKALLEGKHETTSTSGRFESRFWYKVRCSARPGRSLDVVNDGNQMRDGRLKVAADGHYSGQYWQLLPSTGVPTAYRLRTEWLGSERWLTAYVDEGMRPRLATSTGYPHQDWYIDRQADGTYKLSNVSRSTRMLVSSANDNGVEMTNSQTPQPGWILERRRRINEGEYHA